MFDWLGKFRKMAKAAPLPSGRIPDGPSEQALGADHLAVLIIDSNGRVHQLLDAEMHNGTLRHIYNPRSSVIDLLDKFGVQDHGSWNIPD